MLPLPSQAARLLSASKRTGHMGDGSAGRTGVLVPLYYGSTDSSWSVTSSVYSHTYRDLCVCMLTSSRIRPPTHHLQPASCICICICHLLIPATQRRHTRQSTAAITNNCTKDHHEQFPQLRKVASVRLYTHLTQQTRRACCFGCTRNPTSPPVVRRHRTLHQASDESLPSVDCSTRGARSRAYYALLFRPRRTTYPTADAPICYLIREESGARAAGRGT
jgi:hypothetical protein